MTPRPLDPRDHVRIGRSAAVIAAVAAAYKLPSIDLVSSRRDPLIIEARHVAMWMCRRVLRLSLAQIGRQFGDRDHSTILHAIRKTELRSRAEPAFGDALANLLIVIQDKLAARADPG